MARLRSERAPLAVAIVAALLAGASLLSMASCQHAGTSVLLRVSAQPPLENLTSLHLTLATAKRNRTYDVAITAPLDSLLIGIRIPDDVTGSLAITVEAKRSDLVVANATTTLELHPGRSLDASVVLGDVFPDLMPPPPDLETCGNGIVDPGEACDPASDMACPQSAADCDDGTPTTTDSISGDRCTRACVHTPIPVVCVADPAGTCVGANAIKCGAALPSQATLFNEDALFIDPQNALVTDGTRTTTFVDQGKTTGVLRLESFDFALPSGVNALTGVTVDIDHTTIAATVTARRVVFSLDATTREGYTNPAGKWDTNPMVYGNAAGPWASGLVKGGNFNSPDFALELVLQNSGALASINIDGVAVHVFYNDGMPREVIGHASVAKNVAWSKAFTTPEAIRASDTATAHAALTTAELTQTLIGHGYTYQLPSSMTIRGIEVAVTRSASSTACLQDRRVQLWKTLDSPASTNRAASEPWTVAGTTVIYGGPTDLWDTTWTPADVNAATFGAGLAVEFTPGSGNCALDVDAIKTTVYACMP